MKEDSEKEIERLRTLVKQKNDDYNALLEGRYITKDGSRGEIYSVYMWVSQRGCSSRTGHIIAICFDRQDAIEIRNGLRAANENPYIKYETSTYGERGDDYHSV